MTLPMPQSDTPNPDPPVAIPAADQESFVINLCSSTTPMALTQPQLAELKRYKFFVSRRLEDGRERFRLHMGYFDSLTQAEELLPLVRDIYPGAWAGEAPGKRLRTRDTGGAAATPKMAVAPTLSAAPTAAPAPFATPAPCAAPAPSLTPAQQSMPDATILAKAPTLAPDTELTMVAPAPVLELELELVADPPAQAPVTVAAPTPPPGPIASAAPLPTTAAATAAKTAPRAGGFKRDAGLPFDQRSNVREVLKSLDETRARAPAPAAQPPLPAGPVAREPGVLPESQVMRLLEEKRGDPLNTTSTPAAFAIQLQWSVQPIDLAQVPSLAIFGAYTLYTVEGSREGRKWFGLRLGFFSDANSAKTVAQYVRSEFSAVAVVPVSLRERDGANAAQGGPKTAAPEQPGAPQTTIERLPDESAEFKLLEDTAERPKLSADLVAAAAEAAKPKAPVAGKGTPRVGGKSAKFRGNRVHASEKRSPKTLEETLEILGADQLQIEGAKRKPASDGPVRHLDMKVRKNSAFSRLLDRLAERGR
jgi:hypothetical protein